MTDNGNKQTIELDLSHTKSKTPEINNNIQVKDMGKV